MNITNLISVGTSMVFYLIYFYLMNKISNKRDFKHWNILNYSYILLFPIISFVLSDRLYTPLLYFTSFVLYSLLFYRNSFKRCVVNALTFYLIRYLGTYLIQFTFVVIINIVYIDLTYHIRLLIDVLLPMSSLLILFIITKLLLTKILIDDGNEFTNNQFAILLFPSIVGFISLYMFTNYADNQNDLDISSILLALATVCVVFILVYLANIKTLHAKEKIEAVLKEREKFLKENMDVQYTYFQEVQKTQQDLRMIHHDLNHHLTAIKAMSRAKDTDNIEAYIEHLQQTLKPANKIYDTGSGILDVILNEKYDVADQKGIKFMVIGTFEDGCNLDPMSVSVIFANLIDNAIEACDRMKNPKAYKRIQVTFYQDDGKAKEIFILVENTCDKVPIVTNDKDEIVTSKEDKKMHGLGLQSVKSEVGKYGGKLKIDATDMSFRVTIRIPIK